MNKRYLSISLLLLLTVTTAFSASPTKADDTQTYPRLNIVSPKSAVYHNSTIDIQVVVTKLTDQQYPTITGIRYSLNASDIFSYKYANFTYNGLVYLPNNKTGYQYIGNATLTDLKEGNYSLNIMYGQGNDTIGSWAGSSVNFRIVYDDYTPAILLSPKNQTYSNSDVSLMLSTNENYVYAYYCLNGGKPVFINQTNSSIQGITEGSNNLQVFVKFRDIYSDFNVDFTVDPTLTDNSQTLSSDFIFLAVAIVLVVAGLIVIVRRKTHRYPSNEQSS